jgi:shikimate dehydrogenase/3-dehydroquinate dehydratase type I
MMRLPLFAMAASVPGAAGATTTTTTSTSTTSSSTTTKTIFVTGAPQHRAAVAGAVSEALGWPVVGGGGGIGSGAAAAASGGVTSPRPRGLFGVVSRLLGGGGGVRGGDGVGSGGGGVVGDQEGAAVCMAAPTNVEELKALAGRRAVVAVDDALLTDVACRAFLATQPVAVALVEEADFRARDMAEDTAARRRQRASKFDVAVGVGAGEEAVSAQEAAQEVLRVARLAGGFGVPDEGLDLDLGADTFFLSLTFPDVEEAFPLLSGLEKGVDALELRVDLLRDNARPWAVLRQLALLKAHSRLPVIYTVRSKDQCGAFPDKPKEIFKLLAQGLRAGVEVLDVEACWDRAIRDALLDEAWRGYRGTTRLLGSYHVVGRPTLDQDAARIFQECYHNGKVDAVKVVLTAMSVRDSYRVHELAAATKLPCPIVALCLGEQGKLSRVLNSRYTPVTSKLLPFVAAPGQLTAEEIMSLRKDLGMVPAGSFCLLGHPISKSPSPAMHNAAFAHCLLPHGYDLCETEDVNDFKARLDAPDFGGASVTIPHKQAVVPLLDRVEASAEAVGAVNTVVVERDARTGTRRLVGHNTDWKGIVKPVSRKLQEAGRATVNAQGQSRVALVVGGGGTALAAAYAMTKGLGLKLLVFNRTPSKAEAIVERFGGGVLTDLSPEAVSEVTGGQQDFVDVVVSTIHSSAKFTLPEPLLASKPVVMDVAYRPAETALLAQARAAGCPFVQGAEMLIAQGVEQFQLWTKRRAPEPVMRAAVYDTVEELK